MKVKLIEEKPALNNLYADYKTDLQGIVVPRRYSSTTSWGRNLNTKDYLKQNYKITKLQVQNVSWVKVLWVPIFMTKEPTFLKKNYLHQCNLMRKKLVHCFWFLDVSNHSLILLSSSFNLTNKSITEGLQQICILFVLKKHGGEKVTNSDVNDVDETEDFNS